MKLVGSDRDGDGYTEADGDCNDEDGWIWTGAPEMCDAVDNDCNGVVDEGCVGTPADTGTAATDKATGCGCARRGP